MPVSPLEAVDLYSIFLHQTSSYQEIGNLLPLISLKLNDLPQFFVLNDRTITTEIFLKVFQNRVIIVVGAEALNGGQTLPAIALLDADMNILLPTGIFRFCLLERIKRADNMYIQL